MLECISMKSTRWDMEGKMAIVDEVLKRKIRQVAYLDRLADSNIRPCHPKVGRLFLCGAAFAGKTTLRRSLIRYEISAQPSLCKCWSYVKPPRTEGIEIDPLMDSETMHINIWDLAGQDKYRALQSFLFPSISQACIFFFVFSLYDEQLCKSKNMNDLEDELDHWLRFIASNTLVGNDVLPQVVVILTHLDKMQRGSAPDGVVPWAKQGVDRLRARYDGLLDVSPNILVIDATSLRSIAPVHKIVVDVFEELFGKLKLVPQICTRMTTMLAKWRLRNSKSPIMRLSTFNNLCFEFVEELRKEDQEAGTILQAITSYLHDVGVIMLFQNLDFVVVDPNWICHDFLGKLIRFQGTTPAATSPTMLGLSSDGFVAEATLECTLRWILENQTSTDGSVAYGALKTALRCLVGNKTDRNFDERDMIKLMLELNVCCREHNPGASRVVRYFVPNTLKDVNGEALISMRQLKWLLPDGSIHVGRRLQCKDNLRTYLDPGFFPRFQVVLQNSLFANRPEMRPEQYRNELNMIAFLTDGIEVLVEMPGDVGDFIDILVRSQKTAEQTRAFVVKHVLNEMRSFCASPEGSQGVELVEGVIRPYCVTNLILCKYRRDQAVLKSELVGRLLGEHVSNKGCGPIFTSLERLDCSHTWNKVDAAGLPADAERAYGLLDPEDMFEVLDGTERSVRHQFAMVKKAAQVVVSETHAEEDSKETALVPQSRWNATSHSVTMFDLRFTHTMETKVQRKVTYIAYLQQQTLEAVSSLVDKMMNFSGEFLNSELPQRPYFTTNDFGTPQKLVDGIQLCNVVTLQFMCEGPQGNHMVAGQGGLPLTVENAKWEWIQPIAVQSARMLAFLVKAGLDVAAGIGSAVPDFVDALAGESLLNAINAKFPASSARKHSKCVEGAWVFLMDELKPVADKMGEMFQLSKVQDVGGHEQRRAWLCNECLAEEKGKWTTNVQTISIEGTTREDRKGKSVAISGVPENGTACASSSSVLQEELSEDCYPDSNVKCKSNRGAAVIISMESFTNGTCRRGAELDRGRLEALANSLKLDYEGKIFLNSRADFVREELLHIAQTSILTEDECFVCFVSAHGGTGTDAAFFFRDCDGSRISLLTDVVEPFRKCKNLAGKPKIFFVNACRGGLKLQGMDDPVYGDEEQPMPSSWSEGAEVRYVEQEADYLIVFSTSLHAASPRDVEYGTNFVYALVRALNKYRDSEDLLSILTRTNNNLAYMEHEEKDAYTGKVTKVRQCLCTVHSLRKKVYWRTGS